MGRHSIPPRSRGILRSLVLGTVDLGLLHCLKRPFLAPWRGVGSYFPANGHFRPPAPLLAAEHNARRWQAELQANELVGLIPAWR